MKRTLLLWDIDGTLLRTSGAGMRAMLIVAGKLFGESWRWDGINTAGHLDPLIFAEAALLNKLDDDPAHHQRFHDHYIEELRAELQRTGPACAALPGILDTLALLRERERARGDVVQGMLTGNYTKAVPLKLAAVGIDPEWFTITAFGDEARSRPDLVALAMKKYEARYGEKAQPKKVVVIGDTPRDVQCAHAHGCIAVAVTTGHYSMEELRAAGADVVVKDMTEPGALLEVIQNGEA